MAALGISIASMTLATLANPLIRSKIILIENVKEEDLEKLERSIATIKGALLNAEKFEEEPAVKNWIKRVKDVLYDADDLFDETAIDDKLKKLNEVLDSPSTPIISFVGMIKDISECMEDVVKQNPVGGIRPHETMNFLRTPVRREIQDEEPWFVGSENVIGRDEDNKAILKMLSNDNQQNVSVIAIVGMGGMGKTTLAQLVCEDSEVKRRFGDYRWFACISKTSSNNEISGKIFQSIFRSKDDNLNLEQRIAAIQEKISGKKFLIVLDDVWDDSSDKWDARMGIFSRGAKGSKVIVTTRSYSVADAVGASETHHLDGLSEEKSWDLFKRVARITPGKERDSRWNNLGREFARKGANVPLAIRSIASLLSEKNTIEEWELLRNVELPKLGQNQENEIMSVLRLSYNHLSSNLKPCFAYCSLFPKGHRFDKEDLVNLWASQGYVKTTHDSQSIEDMGHSYFMDLFRRCFFQPDVVEGQKIIYWKMHDLIHDLAQEVATGESIILTASSSEITGAGTRHVSVGCTIDDSWADSLNVNKLRSIMCMYQLSSPSTLEKQYANLKCLRALKLSYTIEDVPSSNWELKPLRYVHNPRNEIKVIQSSYGKLKNLRYLDISSNGIKNVPGFIEGLKYLRYLNISSNCIKRLPDDITKLENLCTLNISMCGELKALPSQFRILTNLRSLINEGCVGLKYMPPGFEELTSLQRLDEFRVSREIDGVQTSKLDVLSGLKLTGGLRIEFEDETNDWDRVECWQPPLTLDVLRIEGYQGLRIPHWGNGSTVNQASLLPKLTALTLSRCRRVKHLPPFRHLPSLNCIQLESLAGLETIQGEEEEGKDGSDALYVPPNLRSLRLSALPNLVGWWNVAAATWPPLPSLYELEITSCRLQLYDTLLYPILHELRLREQLLGVHNNYFPPNSVQPSCLQSVSLQSLHRLVSFQGESLTSLRHLKIGYCNELNKVHLAPSGSNILEELSLVRCPELELWEENKRGVDWDSLTELTTLRLDEIPSSEKLPYCLRRRQERGVFKIQRYDPRKDNQN